MQSAKEIIFAGFITPLTIETDMDIYKDSLDALEVPVVFDENDIFSCDINREQNDGKEPLQLVVFRNQEEISLAISVVIGEPIPAGLSSEFITLLAEQALEPLRGGIGIGIYPGTNHLTVYKIVQLSCQPKSIVMEAIESLVNIAEKWESQLLAENLNTSQEQTTIKRHRDGFYMLKP